MNNQNVDDHNLLLISQLYPTVYTPLVPQQGLPILKSQSFFLSFKRNPKLVIQISSTGSSLTFLLLFLILNCLILVFFHMRAWTELRLRGLDFVINYNISFNVFLFDQQENRNQHGRGGGGRARVLRRPRRVEMEAMGGLGRGNWVTSK